MKLLKKAVTTFLILLLVLAGLALKTYYDAGEFSYNGRGKKFTCMIAPKYEIGSNLDLWLKTSSNHYSVDITI